MSDGVVAKLKIIGFSLMLLIAVDDFIPSAALFMIPHESAVLPAPRAEPLQGEVPAGRVPWNERRYGSVFTLTPPMFI